MERRRVFNVDGLRQLAAASVDRSPDDIVDMVKLAEGGSNRAFLITMRGGFQMVARVPYPATVPKYFAVASEVATMALLRSSGLPVPAVYGYAPAPDNAAQTEYIFMREAYRYQAQPPSDHVTNLHRYLRIAPRLVPKDPALCQFCIRHPDLQPGNIIVSRSPAADSELRIVSLIDWQHTAILPLFLLAGVPQCLQNYSDPVSQRMLPPALPANLDALSAAARSRAEEAYHRRVVHYCYVNNTEEHNRPHYDAMTDRACVLRSRLFCHAGDPWEGETIELKAALIRATETWETLAGDDAPCPIAFDAEDVCETMKLHGALEESDRLVEAWQKASGLGPEGWVPTQHYEEAMALCKRMKESALASAETTEEERVQIAAHWPFDDMDEEEYM
ncbi:hypothetical protein IEO21_06639 [Rhodonia placenta]|uniref:Aminoglycoside phosphotransferase domain-containing protein n=1 Tax=Rhodonia placenta TaxID=104341 RepID=A0A8H7P031_9APHY|nr:hypothetical protein IEO21_06639 [Postia placenta]